MTVYSTTFSEYTTGAQPSDWTARWTTTGQTWAVREKAGDTGGKSLEHTRTTTARRLLSWDDIDGDANRADAEIFVRWRTSAAATDQIWCVVRGSGAAATETAYYLHNTSSTNLRISKVVSGTITAIGNFTTTINNNEWYSLRFRANGTALKGKIWASEHESEPAAWSIEVTDSDIVAAGWVGLGNAATLATRDHDDFAVGTNGDTAAFPNSSEARVTQQASLVLSSAPSDARVTQAAVLSLIELMDAAPARVTQATALVVAEYIAGVRITQTATLVLADLTPVLSKWAQTWTITRADGEIFAYTSHDRPIMFRGVSHNPCNSLMASAVELSTAMGANGNQDLTGILSDTGISERDVYNGLFDGAFIESWMVPWDDAGGEVPFRLMGGVIGAADFGEVTFRQEVLSDSARLQQKALLETYTPACRFQFGNDRDPRCPVDAVALSVFGSATGLSIPNASTTSTRRIFTDSTRSEPDGYFNLGIIVWGSGANAGASSEIKDYTAGQFVLWEALLYPIALGDTYVARPGCDKSTADHLVFNADLVDFGGFPDVPGSDSILQSPDAKG